MIYLTSLKQYVKKSHKKIAVAFFSTLCAHQAHAFSVHDAVILAHENNFQILAEREGYDAAKMAKPKAYGGLLPNASVSNAITQTNYTAPGTKSVYGKSKTTNVKNLVISQPIFGGGETYAQIKIADNLVEASKYKLHDVSNNITLNTVQTYENVLATREIYNINIENEKIFAKYLDYTKTRFDAGVVTKTDVLQAEVRYSESIAQKEQSYSSMLNAQATMARLLGQTINEQMDNIDISAIQLPENVDALIEISRSNNPSLMTSKYNANVAQYQINQAVSRVLPKVNATAQFTRSDYAKYNLSNPDSNTYALQVSVPIFQGGGEYASIKEQIHLSHQADYNYKEVDRQVIESSISVWNNYKTSKAIIKSREEAIKAATLALEGVQEEANIGTRTTIDLLNAEKELFDAKVSYRTAKRDYIVSIYQMLQLMGSIEGVTVEG